MGKMGSSPKEIPVGRVEKKEGASQKKDGERDGD